MLLEYSITRYSIMRIESQAGAPFLVANSSQLIIFLSPCGTLSTYLSLSSRLSKSIYTAVRNEFAKPILIAATCRLEVYITSRTRVDGISRG